MANHATREEVEEWFVEWAGRLGLEGWTLLFAYPKQDSDSDMKISITQDRCTGVLSVYPTVFKVQLRSKAWRDVCHECFHLAFASMDDMIVDYVGVGEVFRQYRRELERCIDRLAGCLTGMYPVPDAKRTAPAEASAVPERS